MKVRIVQHQIDAMSNEVQLQVVVPYMEGTVTATKWKACNDCL